MEDSTVTDSMSGSLILFDSASIEISGMVRIISKAIIIATAPL
jgi:hypothetical protein